MPDWSDMFSSTLPFLEVVLRGTLLYLGLLALLRIVGQRESAGLTVSDLLVVVLIGEAATHAMSMGSLSIPEALLMAATMLGWSLVIDALAYRFPRVGRLLKAKARPVIEDGQVDHRVLRRELISREELDEQLRLHGVEDPSEVRRAYLEANGMVSVFKARGEAEEPPPEHPAAM